MDTSVQKLSKLVQQHSWQLTNKRLILPVIILALLISTSPLRELTIQVLADGFWQVAAYVAATLAVYEFISTKLKHRNSQITKLIEHSVIGQIVFSALMGALPGCGGAIIVMTQYVNGKLPFAAVVTVLTATMGDAAFLLLATKPTVGLFVIMISTVVAILSGLVIYKVHGVHFLKQGQHANEFVELQNCCRHSSSQDTTPMLIKLQSKFWQWILIPAITIALLGSFQIDTNHLFNLPANTIETVGAVAAIITIFLWALSREVSDYQSMVSEDPKKPNDKAFNRIALDTNFVLSWVIGAFLAFELMIYWTQVDLNQLFNHWGILLPLIGVAIGLLPGCGPQIIVTSMFLAGTIPLSAQLGNAISNDGDALFPAIALAPKAALIATLYSSIPALLTAYTYFYLFE
ncbi:putative manganese transporter [Photobacterium damselae subsp. damselae]|uniref:putative manganese transporter n=1 Tax=Photobacterium damselae TaxID=38293 RepID=UPI001F388A70|nr:putative manganese transporter [Photobacterium damselae]UJZ95655.1 putative manganese transporter [Photobacterium damselae subsp. damselae]UKA00439.1 putative manganese transporter [Photobacterium damselae subsp. damselae]